MLTFSRIRSIFFTVASLTGVFSRDGGISRGKSGQSSCRRREEEKPQNQKDFWQKAESRPGRQRSLAGGKCRVVGHFGRRAAAGPAPPVGESWQVVRLVVSGK